MAAIALFWYTNMAAVTSDENDLYGMYNFQKLSETTSLCCNNSSENSVSKRYG
jgi:hypothetical protein